MDAPLRDPRPRRLLAVSVLIAALPVLHVVRGRDAAPFAGDLAADPPRYAGRDIVLPFRGVLAAGNGYVEIGDVGGRVRAEAGEPFAFMPGETVDIKLHGTGAGFAVAGVGRHTTRPWKYLVSTPVLLGVGILALFRVRWDRACRGLRVVRRT